MRKRITELEDKVVEFKYVLVNFLSHSLTHLQTHTDTHSLSLSLFLTHTHRMITRSPLQHTYTCIGYNAGGHNREPEKRHRKKRCDNRGTPRQACWRPRDAQFSSHWYVFIACGSRKLLVLVFRFAHIMNQQPAHTHPHTY